MKSTPLLGLLFAASVVVAAPQPEFELSTSGEIVINADGSVRSYALKGKSLGKPVDELVQKNVKSWRFEPVLKDGKPVAAKTVMSLTLLAKPVGEDYVISVNDVSFGRSEATSNIVPPRYPADAIRERLGARVMLAVKLDAQGNVLDVHPHQTSLSKGGTEARARRWRRLFETASVDAVKAWKFKPGEEIDGQPIGNTVMVPISFAITEGSRRKSLDDQWRAYLPGPVTPAPWVDAAAAGKVDTDALVQGEGAALDSRFRLLSDVVGKTL
jgi:TonB family protein